MHARPGGVCCPFAHNYGQKFYSIKAYKKILKFNIFLNLHNKNEWKRKCAISDKETVPTWQVLALVVECTIAAVIYDECSSVSTKEVYKQNQYIGW